MPGRPRPALLLACLLFGALIVVAVRSTPADPGVRLPQRFRLVGLIHREQAQARQLHAQADELRTRLEAIRRDTATRQAGALGINNEVAGTGLAAGVDAIAGPGLRVTLDDSDRKQSPTGNVNDLVFHSQDVQAVVNALWRAGAEAVAINGQRLVSTSAVLCVGNTLLLNGTVHSPPYVVTAIGAVGERFDADRLVRRLHDDADAFGLRFSVSSESDLRVPAFDGAVAPRYAKPTG